MIEVIKHTIDKNEVLDNLQKDEFLKNLENAKSVCLITKAKDDSFSCVMNADPEDAVAFISGILETLKRTDSRIKKYIETLLLREVYYFIEAIENDFTSDGDDQC